MLRRKGRPSRFLAAVVFTDIAGSTEVAARLGDEGWKRLLERHLRLVRSSLYRFGGREMDIRVRSGVHMGEVELIGGKAGGIAVHIGARIAARAEPGEVLVSGTVRDLVTAERVSVLWATHLIDEVADDDDVIVLHQGRILAHGAVTSVVRTLGVQDMRAAFTQLTQELPLQAESEAS